MNRQQAKELLPIIQAFADGKQIEIKTKEGSEWCTLEENDIQYIDFKKCDFRIKSEPKYRPFANVEECWREMQKHQPFGWVKKTSGHCNFLHIMVLYSTGIVINDVYNLSGFKNLLKTFNFAFAEITFADETPFGIKDGD